ncbi:TPA: antirestriction protein ArdR [Escherichia coli]
MVNIRKIDKEKYGGQLYHHYRKQGDHRWDTSVYLDEDGVYTIVFRHSYSKRLEYGTKRTQIRDEKIIRAKSISQLMCADYPGFKDVDILKGSQFYQNLMVADKSK